MYRQKAIQRKIFQNSRGRVMTMKKKRFTELTVFCFFTGIASTLFKIPMQSESQTSIPEPAVIFLFGVGLMGIAGYVKKQSGKK